MKTTKLNLEVTMGDLMKKIISETNLWSVPGKERYYFTAKGTLASSSVFFTRVREKGQRYTWELPGNGWIHAKKCYNGSTKEELEKLLAVDLGGLK